MIFLKKEKVHYGWWIVLGAFVVTATMIPLAVAMSNKFLIPVTQELGITRTSFSLSNSIMQSVGIFLSPFAAKRLATGNFKLLLTSSTISFCLSYAAYGFVSSIYQHYILSVIMGASLLFSTIIPINIMLNNWFVKNRGLAISIAMTGIGVGGFILSPLITFLFRDIGWRLTYTILGLAILVIVLPIVLFIFKRDPADKGLTAYGDGEKERAANEGNAVIMEEETVVLTGKEVFRKSFFWVLLGSMMLNGIINGGALGQFPPAVEGLHGDVTAASVVALYSIVGVVGKLSAGWINDRWGVIVSTLFSCLAFGSAFIFMFFGQSIIMIYLMAISFGIGISIGTVNPPLVTSSIFSKKQYGQFFGYVNSLYQLGLAAGSILVARIFDTTNSYQSAWVLLFILTMLTMIGWIVSYKMSRKFVKAPTSEALAS